MQTPDGVEIWTMTDPEGCRMFFTSGGRFVGFITAGCDLSEEAIAILAQQGMDQSWDKMQEEM